MMINLKTIDKMNSERVGTVNSKNLIYTNPLINMLPYNQHLIGYIKKRLGVNKVSFLKSMTSHYFANKIIKATEATEEQQLILNDGVSMAELTHMSITDFEAYLNIAVVSLFYNKELWVDLLSTTGHTINFQYLDISYVDYKELCKINKVDEKVVMSEEAYASNGKIIENVVHELNFMAAKTQNSGEIH